MDKNTIQDAFSEREAQKYENPIPSREYLLEYLEKRGRPATHRQLTQELRLTTPAEIEALRRRLKAMLRDGQLLKNRRDAYGLLQKMEVVAGYVVGHKDGYGFVIPDEGGEDLFLTPRQMRPVFHGDRVLARVSGIDYRGRREGIIVEVLEHKTSQLVGRFFAESGAAFVEPVNKRITQDILIPPHAFNAAKHGQMVVVDITEHPTTRSRPIGAITEVLGDHMAPGMEIDVAIRNHELPCTWPDAILEAAEQLPAEVTEAMLHGRTDLRHLPLVTIDGEDAKDFDDAVHCAPQESGWILYVAIADVSHYVKPGTALDHEALNRGNSVYFPAHVIPMLPHVLSDELCSLKPKVNRLAMVCEMDISSTGQILNTRFYEAMIRSQARLTYTQVHTMIEKNEPDTRAQFQDLVPHLENLYTLFHILRKARESRGAIDFNLPETQIVYGDDRKIQKIVPLSRYESHRVIEECMLCANISAAHFLEKHKIPLLFRVHEGPSEDKIMDVRKFLAELGLTLPGGKKPLPRDYASLLASIQGRPDAHLIQMVLLRSLSQAVYSPENKGHFGLAYDAYAHFTSPIRRYPDLLTHRAIRQVLQKKELPIPDGSTLEKYAEHCSMTERRADEATEEAIDWLKCEFMRNKVGNVFSGIISGVTSFGFFVELQEIYVEGLVHMSTLPNDYYRFDPLKHTLFGERAGKRFRLGDAVQVQVARVNLDEREIDFVLPAVKNPKNSKRPPKKRKS